MSERLSKIQIALRATTVGAWLFAVGTLVTLILIIVLHWPGTDSTSQIMAAEVDGRDITGIGLRYVGVAGTMLAIFEAVVVLSAIVLSVLPQKSSRRIGHGMLVAWCGLWLVNTIYVAQASDTIVFWGIMVPLMVVLFACTVIRAVRDWISSIGTSASPG